MRKFDCDCGEQLEATTDEQLTRKVQQHFEQSHPETQLSHGRVRSLVSDEAYTPKGAKGATGGVGGGPA